MPITFHMTNDQKPLVIIYDENIQPDELQQLFTKYHFQQPELITGRDDELNALDIPQNNRLVIFANKREAQQKFYCDPTMVDILNVLSTVQIELDDTAIPRFQALFDFSKNLQDMANEMGLSINEFRQSCLGEEGDRISPLLPGLEAYLQERNTRHPSAPKPPVTESNSTSSAPISFFMTLSKPQTRALFSTTFLLMGLTILLSSSFTMTGIALAAFGLFGLMSASRSRKTEQTSTYAEQPNVAAH